MATPTLTPGFTVLSNCDSTTGWSAGTLDTEVVKEGTSSLSGILRTAGLNTRTYTTTTFDSTGQHLRLWLNYASIGFLQTQANGGIRLFAQDTGGAIGYWYVGGIDTYDGGWVLLQVDMDRAFDSGSANKTIINRVGFTLNLTGAPRNATNTWYDYLVRGNALTVTGGTSGDVVVLDGLSSVDAASGYGAVRRQNGVYFVNTNLIFGSASNIFFEDTNQILVFENQPVNSDLYKILATGAGTTSFKLTNSVLKSANVASRFDLLLGDASLETLVFSGNSVVNADQVRFKTGQTIETVVFQGCSDIAPQGATITGSTFSQCGVVTLGGSTLTGCSFLRSIGASALLAGSSLSTVSGCDFVSAGTGHAIEITATGTYTLNDLSFTGYASGNGSTGNETIFVNVASGSVTINSDSALSYRTAGATVTVVAGQKTLSVTNVVSGSDIVILSAGTSTVLASNDGATNPVTSFDYSYTYAASTFVDIAVYKAGYVPYIVRNFLLPANGGSVQAAQAIDRNYLP